MQKQRKKKISLRSQLVFLVAGTVLGFSILFAAFFTILLTNVMSSYVQNDLDYALQGTNSNLSAKTEFLADILLSIRRDNILSAALKAGTLDSAPALTRATTQAALQQAVNIYSDKNTKMLDGAFLDMVYLFDDAGTFNRVSYTDRLTNLQTAIDRQYVDFYREFLKKGTDVDAFLQDGRINIFYTLYDEKFNAQGTLVFAVNESAVRQLMSKVLEYQDAFWYVFGKSGTPILFDGAAVPVNDVAQLLSQGSTPYTSHLGATDYRVCSAPVDMGLGTVLGVSSNQLFLMMYDSVKYYLSAFFIALFFIAIIIFTIVMRLTQPLKEMASKLQMVADERFDTKLPAYKNREFDMISTTFNAMTDKVNYLVNDVYEKKLLVMDMEMRFLQSQTNPHFMYNVLNTIALRAGMDNNTEIQRMAVNFAGLTQARLAHAGDAKVTLEEELQYVRFYLDLQKSRFEDGLQYYIQVQNNDLLQYFVPKLTIEMIVENAVQHGIEPKLGPGTVYIDISGEQNGIRISVEDDGVGFAQEDGEVSLPLPAPSDTKGKHNHIALNNAWQLMRHFYGEEYGIRIQSRRGVGTFVSVYIPYDKEEKHD